MPGATLLAELRTDDEGILKYTWRPLAVMLSTVGGSCPCFCSRLAQLAFRIDAVQVEDENPGHRPCRHGYVQIRRTTPPLPDSFRISGGVFDAVRRRRPFVARPARKDG